MKEIPFYMVFVLYLVISSNFLAQLFSCRLQYLLNNSMLAKHILGYMTLLFFIVLASNENYTATRALADSFLLYFIFLCSTRMSFHSFIVFLFLTAILYIIQLYQTKKDGKDDDTLQRKLETFKKIVQYTMLIVLVAGFLLYWLEKKIEYKNKFSFSTFMLGKPVCKFNKPSTTSIFRFIKQSVSTTK